MTPPTKPATSNRQHREDLSVTTEKTDAVAPTNDSVKPSDEPDAAGTAAATVAPATAGSGPAEPGPAEPGPAEPGPAEPGTVAAESAATEPKPAGASVTEPELGGGEPEVRSAAGSAVADAAERLHRGYTSPEAPASAQRLAVVSVWSLLLVILGVVVALRALLAKLDGTGTGLAGALPSLTVFGGLTGLALTIGAYLTIGARRLPWALLGGATAILFVLMILTALV